ncbi:MAG: helix-turn-helix domain-containing protein [archaeon]
MDKTYLLRETDKKYYYTDLLLVDNPSALKIIDHPIRLKIVQMLAKKPMYPAEIAKELKMHEQKVYYHIKQMTNTGILEVTERKEIRGTTAKKFSPKCLSFAVSFAENWKPFVEISKKENEKTANFLSDFIREGNLSANIVVGSPDPHGPFKARARDGHYAIDLGVFLGKYCELTKEFATKLDVDVDLKDSRNLIVVGGPVTNLICAEINNYLPAKFSDKEPWGIITKKSTYTEDSIGLIAKIRNPFNKDFSILVLAGIRFIGTKVAVMAITREIDLIITRYANLPEFYCVVHGYDLDGDGKIDSVELVE